MKIIGTSMNRPVTVSMVTLAALIFGFVALSRLSLNLLPDISYPTLTIQTEYADAAPAEVEKLITDPLEEAVSVVPGLRHLRSVSRPGVSEITLEFAWKTAMDFASLDVREKIDMVRMPTDAGSPILLRYDPALDPILRIGLFGDKDLVSLRHVGERVVKKDLESLEGVASVRVRGGLEEEIHVEVDEGRLSALGLPISTVSVFLGSQNLNSAGGRLRDRNAEFLVRTLNEFEGLDDIKQTVLYEDAGRRVTLADVAEVTRGFKEQEIISRVRGKEAVELALYKEGNANTVQVAKTIKWRIEQLRESLPEGTDLVILFDQSTFIEQSIKEVRANAIIGGILAIFILFLFLRNLRSTLIVATVIPISIMATFFVMLQFGVTLNIMSLGGLALGVGMLVDNAIVVLEAIERHRRLGKGLWQSTLEGAGEVAQAVTASTLTTVAVFMPIIFVEGIAGQIFRDQALTVTASLLVSLIAALTLIPVLASIGGRPTEEATGSAAEKDGSRMAPASVRSTDETATPEKSGGRKRRAPLWMTRFIGIPLKWLGRKIAFLLLWAFRGIFILFPALIVKVIYLLGRGLLLGMGWLLSPLQKLFDAGWRGLAAIYPRILTNALDHRYLTILLALILGAGTFYLAPRLGVELVPPFSQGQFSFKLELPPGTPLAATEQKVRMIETELTGDPRLAVFFASIGDSPQLGSARSEHRENIALLSATIADTGNREMETAVIEKFRQVLEGYPEIRFTFSRPSYFSFATPVEVHVFGYSIEKIQEYADSLTLAMTGIPGLKDVRSSLEDGSPEVQIRFDRDRIASLNLNLESISKTLRGKIHGDVATRLKERDRQIDIRVRTASATRLNVDDVRDLVISQVDGIPIPLSTIAEIELGDSPSQITHIGQQRAAVIGANVSGRDLGSVTRDLKQLLRENPPPGNISVALGGQNQEVSSSFRSLTLAVLLAIFMVHLVMASQFESFLHPLVILMTVPLGMVGVVFALALTGTAISIVVLIGAVMLTGIVVNNAIVLVDFINQRRKSGLARRQAILDAAGARLRPIFMTTLTTVLGLMPMALGLGEGAEIRAPMAIAVIGGLTLATLLTLIVIPVVYDTVDRKG
jgi:hydrophobic/amphiphilic exporter-1 (mainly G- bacteria), HAE1 family